MNTNEIESRVAKSRQLHQQGYNCCQSVVMAYTDLLPIDPQAAAQMSSAFGRGMSGMQQTCGCVSAMAMVCGLCGQTALFKPLATRFRQENGELNCPALLRMQGRDHSCNDLVASAARLLGEAL